METQLENLVKFHWDVWHSEGLVTDRKTIICKSNDGTIIEVFGRLIVLRCSLSLELANSRSVGIAQQ